MTWLKTRLLAALTALTAILAVLGAVYGKGRSDQRKTREKRDAQDYIKERQKIDNEVSGIGGTDADRIRVLQDIAGRRGQSKD